MDIEKLKKEVEKQLSTQRFQHTLRVTKVAQELAERFGIDQKEVTLAALLHDYAKDLEASSLQSYIESYGLAKELLNYNFELWHGPVGAELVREKLSLTNERILNAIRYHTTGRAGMDQVSLAVFVADYIEPARSFPGVDLVRKQAEEDLELAARQALKNTISFLLSKDVSIHPDTFLAYNDLTNKMGV